MATQRSLGLVCFRVVGQSELTKSLIERVNARRRVMISHTVVPIADESCEIEDRWVARVAVGSTGARRQDINELIKEIGHVLDAGLDEVVK